MMTPNIQEYLSLSKRLTDYPAVLLSLPKKDAGLIQVRFNMFSFFFFSVNEFMLAVYSCLLNTIEDE